jgi:phage-related protein
MFREIRFFKNYFLDFYSEQTTDVQEKIEFVLDLIRHIEAVPAKFLKKVESSKGLFEIRVKVKSNIYRIFCFFDEEQLVILINGFQKKTQKLPKKEILKAEKLKKEYFLLDKDRSNE